MRLHRPVGESACAEIKVRDRYIEAENARGVIILRLHRPVGERTVAEIKLRARSIQRPEMREGSSI